MSDLSGFPCPVCGQRMEVKDSRATNFHNRPSIRRRRRCRKCHWAVTTYEIIDNAQLSADARLGPVMNGVRRAHEAMGALINAFDAETDDRPAGGNGAAEQDAHQQP